MNNLITSVGAFPRGLFLGVTPGEQLDESLLLLFFAICGFLGGGHVIFRFLQARAEKDASYPRPVPLAAHAEIAALVAGLAHRSLDIGSDQLDEPMEKLRIPRGDFLRFLDDLEEDHGLFVPASARAMSTSVSGVIAAICQGG
jgi:hypothetical protein